MATNLLFYGHFTASKAGKTGLTVTVDVDKIDKSTGTRTAVVTGGSATEGRRGYYYYLLANATPLTHDYPAIFITADSSVDQQEVAAVRVDFTEARSAELANLDAAVSSRNAVAPLDATATQAAAAAALTAYDAATGAEVAALPDAILDDEEVSAGVSVRTALAAAGSAADPLLNTVPGSYASGTAGHALGRIANGQLTIVQPVLDDGFFRIVPGRDYLADDGMAFTFSSTSWPTLPDGTTVEFIFGDETLTGERTGDQTVRLEVTAAQGTALAEARSGRQHYDIVATLPSNSVVGLAENAPVLVG